MVPFANLRLNLSMYQDFSNTNMQADPKTHGKQVLKDNVEDLFFFEKRKKKR